MRVTYSDAKDVLICIWKTTSVATNPIRALKYARAEFERRGTLDEIFRTAIVHALGRISRHLASRRETCCQIRSNELNICVQLGQRVGKE